MLQQCPRFLVADNAFVKLKLCYTATLLKHRVLVAFLLRQHNVVLWQLEPGMRSGHGLFDFIDVFASFPHSVVKMPTNHVSNYRFIRYKPRS